MAGLTLTTPFAFHFMTTETIDGVRLTTKANVYFDGKCVSHSFALPDGTKSPWAWCCPPR